MIDIRIIRKKHTEHAASMTPVAIRTLAVWISLRNDTLSERPNGPMISSTARAPMRPDLPNHILHCRLDTFGRVQFDQKVLDIHVFPHVYVTLRWHIHRRIVLNFPKLASGNPFLNPVVPLTRGRWRIHAFDRQFCGWRISGRPARWVCVPLSVVHCKFG